MFGFGNKDEQIDEQGLRAGAAPAPGPAPAPAPGPAIGPAPGPEAGPAKSGPGVDLDPKMAAATGALLKQRVKPDQLDQMLKATGAKSEEHLAIALSLFADQLFADAPDRVSKALGVPMDKAQWTPQDYLKMGTLALGMLREDVYQMNRKNKKEG